MTFYDRKDELDALDAAFSTPGHAFFVVYGRRRVGKTELLKQFCSTRPHVYYLAAQEAERRQREKFVAQLADVTGDPVPRAETWEDALDYLSRVMATDSLVVVIDEFPYLVAEHDALPSYLQAFADEQLPETDSMLVLCGSSVSTMEAEVLGHESPLYGRRTGQIDLKPFGFRQARDVISYELVAAIPSYAVTGGTPMYLTLFEYTQPLIDNIREHILTPTALLYAEPEFLLRTELRNPARYMSILEAIATGHTTPNEVAGATDIDSGPLSKYLQTLRQLRLIDREVPVTAARKQSKRSRYRVADEFLRFWFRYVEPHRSSIEESPDRVLEGSIVPDLPTHVGPVFEDVCTEAVWEAIETNHLDPYGDVGRWWYGEDEIDIVGLAPDDDRILLAECKWTNEPVGHSVASNLRAKADRVRWGPSDRTERFAIFSKSGFIPGLAADLDGRWQLFDLDDLDTLFSADSSRS